MISSGPHSSERAASMAGACGLLGLQENELALMGDDHRNCAPSEIKATWSRGIRWNSALEFDYYETSIAPTPSHRSTPSHLMVKLFRNLVRSFGKDMAHGQAAFTLSRPELALRAELQRRAMLEAADFVKAEMPNALFCEDRLAHLEYALSQRQPGPIVEFGVYKATTTNFIAQQCPETTSTASTVLRACPSSGREIGFPGETSIVAAGSRRL